MQTAPTAPARLVSRLIEDDPELADIVVEFVSALPNRVQNLENAWREQAWDRLTTIAHQLKGAGGSYGYPALSALGATMEQGFKTQSVDDFDLWLAELKNLVAAARAGLA